MGKGSAPRPFTDRAVFEDNFDKIFGKKDKTQDPITKPFPHNILKQSRIDTIGQNGNNGDHYEYELNKSTGNVEKVFKDSLEQNDEVYKRLRDGIDKPSESQFDGD